MSNEKKKKTNKVSVGYDDSHIKHLENTDAIRKRPTMYIGQVGTAGVLHLFIEAFGNSLDEKRGGFCDEILVIINQKTNTITVKDNGRGIPPKSIELVSTKTHAGGKMDDDNPEASAYANYSLGLNGVGLTAINALSESLTIIVKRDGYAWKRTFKEGKTIGDLERLEKTKETGTTVTFIPDKKVMRDFELVVEDYASFCENIAYLNEGLKITFQATLKNDKTVSHVFNPKRGLEDFIDKINPKKIKGMKDIHLKKVEKDMETEIVFSYHANDDEIIRSFVNGGMETRDHGTHVTAFKQALTATLNKYITDNNMIPKKDLAKLEITGDDIREGLVAIVSVMHRKPEFVGQTKDKLSNNDIMGQVKKLISNELPAFLDKNKPIAKLICERIILTAKGRIAAKKAKTSVMKQSDTFLTGLNDIKKFTPCTEKDPKLCEIIVVEGDSAGGTVTDARDPKTQAIFKLKGKPMNTHDSSLVKILDNKELHDFIKVLGIGVGKDFDVSKLKYHKIIWMCDADVDGSHIRSLLSTLVYRHMRPLFMNGHIYEAHPPLYKIMEGKKEIFIQNKTEHDEYLVKKVIDTFDVYTGKKDNLKPVNEKKLREFISTSKYYLFDLDSLSSKVAINPELLQIIIDNIDDEDSLRKKLKTIGLEIDKKHIVQGMYNDNFYYFEISKELIHQIKEFKKENESIPFSYMYCCEKGGKPKRLNIEQVLKLFKKVEPKHAQRFKGLGEMNSDQLWTNCLNPKTRKLTRLKVSSESSATEKFEIHMGNNADKRKDFMKGFTIRIEDIDN